MEFHAYLILACLLFAALLCRAVTIWGATRMLRGTSYGMGVTGSILAMIPCSPLWIASLPLGVWSLAVLTRRDVKAGFAGKKPGDVDQLEDASSEQSAQESAVRGPAIGLIIFGGMQLLVVAMYLLGTLADWEQNGFDAAWQETLELGPIILTGMVLSVPVSILVIIGAVRMMNRQSYRLAVATAILAILPLTFMVVTGVPFGIWALAVLSQQRVKSTFPATDRGTEDAVLAQVRRPGIGLLITGVLNWITTPVILLFLTYLGAGADSTIPQSGLVALGIGALVLSGFLFLAAFLMMRLRAYPLCLLGSVLAMIITPGNLLGLPIGIWALVVLSQKDVREAFTAGREGSSRTGSSDGQRIVQAPADALILVAGAELLTGIGIVLWLATAAFGWDPTASSGSAQDRLQSDLLMISITYVILGAFMAMSGLLMRRLRVRLLVLLSVVLAGILLPATLALNVVMEREHIPEWPVGIPMWLGIPFAVWATVVLFRHDVRAAFTRSASKPNDQDDDANGSTSVQQQLRGPAFGLMVNGSLVFLPAVYLFVSDIFVVLTVTEKRSGNLEMLAVTGVGALLGALILRGAWSVLQLESYRFALLGSILGQPMGIWALWHLLKPEVRAAFRKVQNQNGGDQTPDRSTAGRLLSLAISLILCAMVMLTGSGLLVIGLLTSEAGSDSWWGWMSGAFAATIGGGAGLTNTWNRYRRQIGTTDLLQRRGWFWLDTLILVYCLLGLGLMAGLPLWLGIEAGWPAFGLGTIVLIQSVMFLIWRSPMWKHVPQPAEGSRLDRHLIVIAFGLVLTTLLAVSGIAGIIVGLMQTPGTKQFWGILLAGLGLLLGGGGSLYGLWKTFGQWSASTEAEEVAIDRVEGESATR